MSAGAFGATPARVLTFNGPRKQAHKRADSPLIRAMREIEAVNPSYSRVLHRLAVDMLVRTKAERMVRDDR